MANQKIAISTASGSQMSMITPGRDKVVVVVGTRQVLVGVAVGARRDARQDQGDDVRDHVEDGPHEAGRAAPLLPPPAIGEGSKIWLVPIGATGEPPYQSPTKPPVSMASRLSGWYRGGWFMVSTTRAPAWRAAGRLMPSAAEASTLLPRARSPRCALAKIIHYTLKSSTVRLQPHPRPVPAHGARHRVLPALHPAGRDGPMQVVEVQDARPRRTSAAQTRPPRSESRAAPGPGAQSGCTARAQSSGTWLPGTCSPGLPSRARAGRRPPRAPSALGILAAVVLVDVHVHDPVPPGRRMPATTTRPRPARPRR